VASDIGFTTCDNGHQISLLDLLNTHIKEGTWTSDSIGGLWPSVDATRAIIKRVATPEFLRSTSSEWQNQIVSYWPFVSWLIKRAEMLDRKAALTLKDFLEKMICERFIHLGVYLRDMAITKNISGCGKFTWKLPPTTRMMC
jgi:hypothetical protein